MHKTRRGKRIIFYNNKEEYHATAREIWQERPYDFVSPSPTPTIVDAGAHIGLSTVFFLEQYPQAQIYALEPHPKNYACLERTIFENNLTNVTAVHAALWHEHTQLALHADTRYDWWSTTSITPGSWQRTQPTSSFHVEIRTLADVLDAVGGTVDLLKLDIEGAESNVLFSAEKQLKHIKQIRMEHHPNARYPLTKLLQQLAKTYTTIEVRRGGTVIQPRHARGLVTVSCS